MALSDACFEFLQSVSEAAAELGREAHRYSDPDAPLQYGFEVDALRRASLAIVESPYDPAAGARLLELAASVLAYHDTPPGASDAAKRKASMNHLVHELQQVVAVEDAASVPAVVAQAMSNTPYSSSAAQRLKVMLSKLGKPAYEIAVKIAGDIGGATIKRILGL